MIPINEIRDRYKNYDDSKILHLAKNDSRGLRKEVVPILIAEIERRHLNRKLIDWINAERRQLNLAELVNLKNKIKNCVCTSCGKKHTKLKGFHFTTITGIIIEEFVSDFRLIICEKCGRKKRRSSALWTAVF